MTWQVWRAPSVRHNATTPSTPFHASYAAQLIALQTRVRPPAAVRRMANAPRPRGLADRPAARATSANLRRRPAPLVLAGAAGAAPSGPRGNDRRGRVRRQAAEVAAALDRLEAASGPLESYKLSPFASFDDTSDDEGEAGTLGRPAATLRRGRAPPAPPARPPTPSARMVAVCTGKTCAKRGAARLLATLAGAPGVAAVGACKCLGQCERGPTVRVVDSAGRATVYTGVGSPQAVVQLQALLHE